MDVFEVEVEAREVGEAAFADGLRLVITRATGSRLHAGNSALAALLRDPSRAVMSYRRLNQRKFRIRYDAKAVESAIQQAGLPFWGEERPLTMVWVLAKNRDGTLSLVGQGDGADVRAMIELLAAERGLPIAWPSSLSEGAFQAAAESAWSGDLSSLQELAETRGASAILVGRPPDQDWSSGVLNWSYQGPAGSGAYEGNLRVGLERFADALAYRLTLLAEGDREGVEIVVGGVSSAEHLARLMRQLEAVTGVDGVRLRQVDPESVTVLVSVRGGLDSLRVQLAGIGIGVDQRQGANRFVLRP